jgi:hypothetical protein
MWLDSKWVGRYPPDSTEYGKIGFPEPWHPVPDSGCTNMATTYYSIRQFLPVHTLGIYRRGTNKNLEVRFDDIKQGFTYDDVRFPHIKISNPVIVTTFDSLTSTWDATFTFNTDTVTNVTLSYDPVTDGCSSCGYSRDTTVTGTNHTVVLEDIEWAPLYCYSVRTNETPRATELTGTFDLNITQVEIYDVAFDLDSTECELSVEWKTKYPSKGNVVKYWPFEEPDSITVVNADQSDCDTDRYYSLTFDYSDRTEFVIRSIIEGETVYSDTLEQDGDCDSGGGGGKKPPDIPQVEEKEVVIEPFIKSTPNPFNPSTAISFGVPKSAHVDLRIYDVSGKQVRTLYTGRKNKGIYSVVWDGTNARGQSVSSGVYFSRIIIGETELTSKLIFLK